MKSMTWRWPVLLMVTAAISRNASAQGAPPSPIRPWQFSAESEIREHPFAQEEPGGQQKRAEQAAPGEPDDARGQLEAEPGGGD